MSSPFRAAEPETALPAGPRRPAVHRAGGSGRGRRRPGVSPEAPFGTSAPPPPSPTPRAAPDAPLPPAVGLSVFTRPCRTIGIAIHQQNFSAR